MHFSTTTINRAGTSRTIRPNTFQNGYNNVSKDNYIEFFKNIKQAKEVFLHQRAQSNRGTVSSRPPIQVSSPRLGASVKNVRGDINKNEAYVEDINPQHIDIHDALIFNGIFSSLDSSFSFLKKSENDAMAFLRKEENIRGLDKFFTTLSTPDNNAIAVAKIKRIFVMLKMLNESYTHDGNPVPAEVKKDIQFYVDNVNKYGLKSKSPYAGSLLKGASVLKAIDLRINKNSAEMIAKGLNYNAAIDRMVESKINTVSDKTLRETLLSKWKDISFRESKRVFDRMENVINGCTHFQRIDALLEHQPIKLDLFKDYLQREGTPQRNGSGNTGGSKPDNNISKRTAGPNYIFNDHSITVNDHSITVNDNSIRFNDNQPNEQGVKLPPSAIASVTQHQNFTNVSERSSDHGVDDRGRSNLLRGRGTEVSKENLTNNRGERVSEIRTSSGAMVGQEGYDLIDGITSNGLTENITGENHSDGSATRGKADSTSSINAELDMRTSVQHAMPPILNNLDSSVGKSQRPYIGPFRTGRTGAAQYQQDWQPALVTSDRRLIKNNQSLTTLSSRTEPVKNSAHHRLFEEKVSALGSQTMAGKPNVSTNTIAKAHTAASSTRERAQGVSVLNRPVGNAAMVQSSELSTLESRNALSNFEHGRRGSELNNVSILRDFWESQRAERQQVSPEIKPKYLSGGSNTVAVDNDVGHDQNKPENVMRTDRRNLQKLDTYMGPHRTVTGHSVLQKVLSGWNESTTHLAQNTQTGTKRDLQRFVKETSVRVTEKEHMAKTDVPLPIVGDADRGVKVEKNKVDFELATIKRDASGGMLSANTSSSTRSLVEKSFEDRRNMTSSHDKSGALASAPYRGPFWAGRQGAARKQAYINTDELTKK